MPENYHGMGSDGLQQGGASLGSDYKSQDFNAGDALASADVTGLKQDDDENLAMDQESSRNLSPDADLTETDNEELFDDEEDDEDLDELDETDSAEEEENTLERGL